MARPYILADCKKIWNNKKKPNEHFLPKKEYIIQWLSVFDSSFLDDKNCSFYKDTIEKLSRYSVLQLKTSFEWILEHFCDLALGGNYGWYRAIISILNYQKRNLWNEQNKKKIIIKYLSEI